MLSHTHFILTQSSGQTTDTVAQSSFTQPDATVRTQDTETVWLRSVAGLRLASSETCVIADILEISLPEAQRTLRDLISCRVLNNCFL